MKKIWINGAWVDSPSGQAIEVTDPATGEILDAVPAGTPKDVERAVTAAQAAFPAWRQTTAVERAQMLHEAAAKMREHFDELSRLLTLEEGKPLPENEEEMDWSLNTLDYYAELAIIFALWVGVAAVLLALAGWWFFDEALSLRRLAGLALVVGGMVLLLRQCQITTGVIARSGATKQSPPLLTC